MFKGLKTYVAVGFVMLAAPALAQSSTPEARAAFILEIAGFSDDSKDGSKIFYTTILKAIEEHNNRPYKITPSAAKRFAKIAEEEFAATTFEFKAIAASYLVRQLEPNELEALYNFYSSPLGLSASTKFHFLFKNVWTSITPQVWGVLWPKVRERLSKDPELRKILVQ